MAPASSALSLARGGLRRGVQPPRSFLRGSAARRRARRGRARRSCAHGPAFPPAPVGLSSDDLAPRRRGCLRRRCPMTNPDPAVSASVSSREKPFRQTVAMKPEAPGTYYRRSRELLCLPLLRRRRRNSFVHPLRIASGRLRRLWLLGRRSLCRRCKFCGPLLTSPACGSFLPFAVASSRKAGWRPQPIWSRPRTYRSRASREARINIRRMRRVSGKSLGCPRAVSLGTAFVRTVYIDSTAP